jgi:hypothetical protein
MALQSFTWIVSALGVIVGFSVTRIATSCVHMFVARDRIQMDWAPFAWAATVFALLLHFAWTIALVDGGTSGWRFGVFLMLLALVLCLFAASTLILPNSESQAEGDLAVWYRKNGRWAMPFLVGYAALAYPFDWCLVGWSPAFDLGPAILAMLATVAFFSTSRRVIAGAAAVNLAGTFGLLIQMVVFQ